MCSINSTLLWWFIRKGKLNFQFEGSTMQRYAKMGFIPLHSVQRRVPLGGYFSMHLDPYLFSSSLHGRITAINLQRDTCKTILFLLLSAHWAYTTQPILPSSKMFGPFNGKQVAARQQVETAAIRVASWTTAQKDLSSK